MRCAFDICCVCFVYSLLFSTLVHSHDRFEWMHSENNFAWEWNEFATWFTFCLFVYRLLILTTSKKKSTCGRLCTKNRTGCRSIVTLTVKSCGVPGLTVFLGIASWCEWISVSSKSNTNVFRCTMLKRCRDTGDSGNKSYLTGWYWTN